ncbi:DNA-3-methyladenine glycosylase 2 family protein [Thalassotalea sp. PS06]|uniref:DNA-3-methyladenine glycosylase 2 family protein n=1 Tax=Thalassotalea sp. PS06 TaxID=2594005 RepID=UPI0011636FEB|nr:DNA-3-methyladenine glycosylase 2 [Thalassotalea sp. PS06]QDP00888.1 DNA-3-methyladenine glycosylase 2 family protein [Thalassotalea sp. PS06]
MNRPRTDDTHTDSEPSEQFDFTVIDPEVCHRARMSRDERFDGQFYTAVLSTGIYCRPICPARSPKEENVRYYFSAAQAEHQGYRPCKRCRPELAPQSRHSTLSSMLKQVKGDPGIKVKDLARSLHISERQLQRQCQDALGMTPKAFINQQRGIIGRKYLIGSNLSVTDVAYLSGFNNLRSFNQHIKSQYGCSPIELREQKNRPVDNTQSFDYRLNYQGELNWPLMLSFLRGRQIPGVEYVDDNSYQRSIEIDGISGWFKVTNASGENLNINALNLEIYLTDYSVLDKVVRRVRHMFDLDCDLERIRKTLSSDKRLATIVADNPGLRLPGCWDIFEFTIRAILGQQITVKAATTLAGRIANRFGTPVTLPDSLNAKVDNLFPTIDSVMAQCFGNSAELKDFQDLGITTTRQTTLLDWLRFYQQHQHWFNPQVDFEKFVDLLCQQKGIGPWTAHYIAMRGVGVVDAFPAEDLGIIKALAVDGVRPKKKEILESAEKWRPWRAYAAIYLWHSLSN